MPQGLPSRVTISLNGASITLVSLMSFARSAGTSASTPLSKYRGNRKSCSARMPRAERVRHLQRIRHVYAHWGFGGRVVPPVDGRDDVAILRDQHVDRRRICRAQEPDTVELGFFALQHGP